MKLLIDENISGEIIESLKYIGYDLLWIREYYRGISDEEIMDISISEDRIIITLDKDFGTLVFKTMVNDIPGVILIRIEDPKIRKEKLLKLLIEHGNGLKGYFTVITKDRIRKRRLFI